MDRKTRQTLSFLSSLCFCGFLSLSLCVCWFYSKNAIDVEELTGSVLKKYFEDGDGSQSHPFEIARPKQYENYVKLHYEMEGFADRGFYFVFGHNFGDADAPNYKFYTYSDSGVFSSTPSDILNMTSIGSLPPLGSDRYPFKAKLNGNNLTVSNFTVVGTGFADVGIFGYVDSEAVVSNCYFSNFTIDLSESAYPEVLMGGGSYSHIHDDENVFLGYIAGHLSESQFFTNVYVNNCRLIGAKQNSKTINNYGYYGKADLDSLGGQTGVGSNYEFELNAKACYSYLNSAYNTISDKRLLLRNTEESVVRDSSGNVVSSVKDMDPLKLDSAVSRNGLTYSLTGTTPTESAERTYSLSTTGFRGYPMHYEDHYFDVVYTRNGVNAVPAYDAEFTTKSLQELLDEREDKTQDLQGDYIYYNNGVDSEFPQGWRFMHANARQTTVSEHRDDLSLSFSGSFTPSGNVRNPSIVSGSLLIDKIPTQEELDAGADPNEVIPIPKNKLSVTNSDGTFTVNCSGINLPDLKLGEHHIAIDVKLTWEVRRTFFISWWENRDGSVFFGTRSGNVLSEKSFKVTNYMTSTPHIQLSGGYENDLNFDDGVSFVWQPTPYWNNEHFDLALYGAEIQKNSDGTYSSVSTSAQHSQELTNSGITFDYLNGRWVATENRYEENTSEDPVDQWIGDSEQMVESGYSSENLDVVGGNVQFYSTNLGGNTINVISVPSESSGSTNYVRKIKSADVGQPFYAPSRCMDSIVLYIKNTANARDNRDDILGKIDFSYATVESIGQWLVNLLRINIGRPVFKKGDRDTLQLSDFGTTKTNFPNVTMSLPELRESDIKKASFCALDREGKILGNFDNNGNPSVGFSGADESYLKDIDTYVVAIGCYSTNSSSTNTWITDIQFSYKAEVGYGGTFGSVGYRSAEDTIENTILNFAIVFEESSSNHFEILVYFVKDENDEDTLLGIYHIEIYTDNPASINIYNYYPDNYGVSIKISRDGEEESLSGMKNIIVLPGGTY